MKELPKMLYDISRSKLLSSAVFNHELKDQLLPNYSKLGSTYQIDQIQIGETSLNGVNLYVSTYIKSCNLAFELDGVKLFENANEYFLNSDFLKEECWLGNFKNSKMYIYILDKTLLEARISRTQRNGRNRISISSKSVEQVYKVERDVELVGDLIYSNSFSMMQGTVQNREATSEEVEHFQKSRNMKLGIKTQQLKNKMDQVIHGLESFDFYDAQNEIKNIYLSKELKSQFINNGFSEGKNKVQIVASLKRYNDFSVIIDEVISLQIENTK